jgi:hypothetical protein
MDVVGKWFAAILFFWFPRLYVDRAARLTLWLTSK